MPEITRVTHLFDCAGVGAALVGEGRRQNQPWRQVQGPWTRGGTQRAYYRFLADLALHYPRTEVWHVHMGGRARWARGKFARPYVLTLHGTDIRENYWQAEHHESIRSDIVQAQHVFYTTPDLREKAERARSDAEYLPVALDLRALPAWTPSGRPQVFFPSRWDESKGGDNLLAMAAEIVRVVGPRAEMVGIDWGDRAVEAAALGIRLLPKMSRADFLSALSHAHVAVGQATGALGVSELQTMAIGVPLIFPDPVEGHPRGPDAGAVVIDRADAGHAVLDALVDPPKTSMRVGGPAYVRRHHDVGGMVDRLRAVYADASGRTRVGAA